LKDEPDRSLGMRLLTPRGDALMEVSLLKREVVLYNNLMIKERRERERERGRQTL
jgi:hypothetical protein